jgi:hypothetical protein
VFGVDNYPLMKPYDSASFFAVYTPPPEQQPNLNLTESTQAALVVAVIIILIVAVAAIIVHYKKPRAPKWCRGASMQQEQGLLANELDYETQKKDYT